MTLPDALPASAAPGRPRLRGKRRRRLRWILAIIVALVLCLVAAAAAAAAFQHSAAPLSLPAGGAPPAGPLAQHWRITPGSVAGFRIQQHLLGATSDVTGRTEGVTGTMTLSGDRIATAEVRIDLLTVTDAGKAVAPQFATSLDTAHFPQATVRLTEPVPLTAAFASGSVTDFVATGQLTLHGVTHTITASMSARCDATGIAITGSVPIGFADYGIAEPEGYGALGSLADHGLAEFLLLWQDA